MNISIKHTSIFKKISVVGVFLPIALMAFMLNGSRVSAASESYTYASNGSKITGKGGAINNGTVTFTKGPKQDQSGNDIYTGSAVTSIKNYNGTGNTIDCTIGLQIVVKPNASSGTISAPPNLNGIAEASSAGTDNLSCDKNDAQKSSAFNKSISVNGSTSTTAPPAAPDETAGQSQIVVDVLPEKDISKLTKAQLAGVTITHQMLTESPSPPDSKTLDWNVSGNAGEVHWNSQLPGTYKICIAGTSMFTSTIAPCQTVTKVKYTPLIVSFGSAATSFNADGKKVDVTVHLNIPAAIGVQDYGPVSLTLFNTDTSSPAGTADTIHESIGLDQQARPDQTLDLGATLNDVNPGNYKVCVTGSSTLCSTTFAKVVNEQTSTELTVPVGQSSTFLTVKAASTCVIPGIGWLVCPIVNFMAGANDGLYGILSGLLVVDTDSLSTTSTNNGAYIAWGAIRNIANVGLVIVFLIIIFSQISGFGISNYGVKKMLPRLVIAAVLINVSFLLCQVAVDIFNILGGSILPFFDNLTVFGPPAGVLSTSSVAGGILAGTVAIGAVAAGVTAAIIAGSLLIPVLVAALLAIFVTVLILATRKVVIILLVVLAPVAFLAMLLPGTEGLYKQWRKILIAMLIVYPEIGLLFAGSTLASKIITSSATDALQQIIGIIVTFVPLLVTPFLLQSSLKAVPMLGNFASKLVSRANQNVSKSAAKRLKPLVDSALSNREAGLTWRGKERYKKTKDGYAVKRKKDGSLVALRDKDNKLIPQKNGAKLDEHGKVIQPKRRTFSQTLSQRGQLSEKNVAANKALTEANYGTNALAGNNATGRAANVVTDRSKSAHLKQEAVDKIYDSRLKSRQLNHSTSEHTDLEILHGAEDYTKFADKSIEDAHHEAIKSNEDNMAAAAIGIAGEGVELKIGHDEQGKALTYEEGEVDAEGVVHAAGDAKTQTVTRQLDQLGGLNNATFAVESKAKAGEEEIKQYNEESGVSADATHRTQTATKSVEAIHGQEEAELQERLTPTGDLADVQARIDTSNTLTEEQKAAQADEVARRKGIAEAEGGLRETADRKSALDETTAGRNARAKARLDAAKINSPGVNIPDMDTGVREQLQAAAIDQAAGGRNSQIAGAVEKLTRSKEIAENPDGPLARDLAGIDYGLSETTNVEAATAAKDLRADEDSDTSAIEEMYENENLGSEAALKIFGANYKNADVSTRVMPDTGLEPDTSQMQAAIRRIAQSPDKKANVQLSRRIGDFVEEAEKKELAAEGTPEGSPERKAATEARKRAKRLQGQLYKSYVSNPSSMPPFWSSEDLDQLKSGEYKGNFKKQVAYTLAGAKFTAQGVAGWNIDQIAPVAELLKNTDPKDLVGVIEGIAKDKGRDPSQMLQSLANFRSVIDRAEDDPAYALEERTLGPVQTIRERLIAAEEMIKNDPQYSKLSLGAKNPDGTPYVRVEYSAPGQQKVDESGRPVPVPVDASGKRSGGTPPPRQPQTDQTPEQAPEVPTDFIPPAQTYSNTGPADSNPFEVPPTPPSNP